MSFLQAVVLLLFNSKPILSYQQIKQATNIEEKELKRTLQSLACGKVRVIAKNPLTREVNEEDKFAFNKKFTSKLYRLKINQIQIEETVCFPSLLSPSFLSLTKNERKNE